MQSGRISSRYARALYEFSSSENSLDEVYHDSDFVTSLFINSKEFNSLLSNPVISTREKEQLVFELLKTKTHPTLLSFINLMVRKNREAYILGSMIIYKKLYREKKGILKVIVEMPHQISKETQDNIERVIQTRFKKQAELEMKIKPELLGGFVLQVEDQLIDQSVWGQLKKIRKTLIPEK